MTPLRQKDARTPLGKKDTRTPLGKKDTRTPLGQKDTRTPLGQKDTRAQRPSKAEVYQNTTAQTHQVITSFPSLSSAVPATEEALHSLSPLMTKCA